MAKALSKTQKRLDNNIRIALTAECEQALKDAPGFQRLTHQASYENFPASLLVTCVFDTEESIQSATANDLIQKIRNSIQARLFKVGVKLSAPKHQVFFDTEEACLAENEGNWKDRLASRKGRALSTNRPADKRR